MGEARTPWDWPSRQAVLELDFSLNEYSRRLDLYQNAADSNECDLLLLHGSPADDASARHLSGLSTWWGHSFVAVRAGEQPVLCTSAIAHNEPMHSNVQTTWIRDLRPAAGEQAGPTSEGLIDRVADVLPMRGRIGYADSRSIPVALFNGLVARRPDVVWVDCSDAVRAVRRIKSPEELAALRDLGAATSAALEECLNAVSSHVSEREIAAIAHAGCISRGVETMNFGCFALSGYRSIFKNAWPTSRRPQKGDVVVVDLGATSAGYHSDISRNRFVGLPSDKARRAAVACVDARNEALATIRPGVVANDVVRAMNSVVADHGLGEWDFSLCHGIGMQLVEAPYFRADSTVLEPGMVFCVEPIVAPPDIGTLCIEEMVAVTDSGYELMSPTPVEPIVTD